MNCEMLGVTKVIELLAKSDFLTPNINANDREPSWDGDVEVYRKAGNVHRKENLIIRVPVQIKGRSTNKHPKVISFSVNVADLENYLVEGGTIFFVVYVDSEGERKQVYYKELLPFDLKKLCANAAGQLTKSIRLEKFPTDKNAISNIFLNFAADMKRQRAAISADSISIDDLIKDGFPHEISFSYTDISRDTNRPFDYLFHNRLYLYATCEHGIQLPVEYIEGIQLASLVLDNPVEIDNKTYYQQYEVVYEKEGELLRIGKGISVKVDPTTRKTVVTLTFRGTLSERTHDLEFMIEALRHNEFTVNGVKVDLSSIAESEREAFNIPEQEKQLAFLKRVLEVFECLHVNSELDISAMNDKSAKDLQMLIDSVLDGKEVALTDNGTSTGIVTIGNLKILVLAIKNQQTGLFKVSNYYTRSIPTHWVMENGNEITVPIGIILNRQILVQMDNLDFSEVIEELNEFPKTPDLFDVTTLFLLEIIHAVDDARPSKRILLLEGAKQISNWVLQNDDSTPKSLLLLNEYQIRKRERDLAKEETDQITEIIETERESEEILTAAYLLLDNQRSAERHFKKMEPGSQEKFQQYPIYHFWNHVEES